jgi:hypothetical protein
MKKLMGLVLAAATVLAVNVGGVSAHSKPKPIPTPPPVTSGSYYDCQTGFWVGPHVGPRPSPFC